MTRIARIRGITRVTILTAGARATPRSAAIANKIRDLPMCDAAQRMTATNPIQASVVKGMATRLIHLALEEIAVRQVSTWLVCRAMSADVVDEGVREEGCWPVA